MNTYRRKWKWKLWLVIGAAIIVGASLWYTNLLTIRIAEEEKKKVIIWAEAIENKAQLVKYTNQLFDRIAEEEREKVQLWADATKILIEGQSNLIDPFAVRVVRNNNTVPVILTDESLRIIDYLNIEQDTLQDISHLDGRLKEIFSDYDPLIIESEGILNFIYYRDSKLFREVRLALKDLIHNFESEIVINSASVPVVYTNSQNEVIKFGNLDTMKARDPVYLQEMISSMESENVPIKIDLGDGEMNYVYYKDSPLLKQIKYYPYIQFGIIGLFLFIAYYAFSTTRRVEQNQVWVGMAKETAHQLGTPISSLVAWVEYFRETGMDEKTTDEIEKDVQRLELITERFSKIGSAPQLKETNIVENLENNLNYLGVRASKKVAIELKKPKDKTIIANINPPLFNWVLENLVKNALDAMNGEGSITIIPKEYPQKVVIDVIDSGKGIPKSDFKTIFQPGFSTKKRGWGLGLSLTKRIIENYHSGKIFVEDSMIGKGSTFRIILPKPRKIN